MRHKAMENWKIPWLLPSGTTYDEIYKDLCGKDRALYTDMGMLHILERNRRLKEKPERFDEAPGRPSKFVLILTQGLR